MPETYRRKPKTIEVCRWTGDNVEEVAGFLDGKAYEGMIASSNGPAFTWTTRQGGTMLPAQLWVKKSQAWCDVRTGDGIAREPDGDGFYPVQAERLKEDFEREEDVEQADP
jgi:hypothetical protein